MTGEPPNDSSRPGYPKVPEDDEPVTDEELEAFEQGHQAYLRGETIPHDVMMRELGLIRSEEAAQADRRVPDGN